MSTENLEELKELQEEKQSTNEKSSLLDEYLMREPPEIQRKVRATVEKWNLNKNDIFFLILISCKITQIFYEEAPSDIERAFQLGNEEIVAVLESYAKKLSEIQIKSLAKYEKEQDKLSNLRLKKQVAKILEENNLSSGKKGVLSPRVAGSFVTAIAVLFGSVVSFWGGTQFNNSAMATNWRQELEAQERVLLDWAKSPQGQLAKNIVEWNEDLIDKSCQKKVKDLGISFQVGSYKIENGFCVVWVEPTDKRR